MITALGFALAAWAMQSPAWARRDWRLLPAFGAGFVLWANFHTGALIFLGILAIELGAATVLAALRKGDWRDSRFAAAVLFISGLACLVTPYGIAVPLQVIRFMRQPGWNQRIAEHMPFDIGLGHSWVVLLIAAIVATSAFAYRRRFRPGELLAAGFMFALTIFARRNATLFAVFSFGMVARALHDALELFVTIEVEPLKSRAENAVADACWLGVSAALAGLCLCALPVRLSLDEYRAQESHPIAAAEYVRANLSRFGTRMYNIYEFGSFLTYALPERKTFVDGRADFFGFDLTEEAWGIREARPGARAALERWQIDWVIVRPGAPLIALLEGGSWKRVYADRVAVVLQRAGAAF